MRYNNPYMRKGAAAPAAPPVAAQPELIDYRNKLKDTNRRISDLEQRRNSGNVDRYTYEDQDRMLNAKRKQLLEGYAKARANSQQPQTPVQPKQPPVQPQTPVQPAAAKQQTEENSSAATGKGGGTEGSNTLSDRDDLAILESKISELTGYGYNVDKETGRVTDSNGKDVGYVGTDGVVLGLDGNPVDLNPDQTTTNTDMGVKVESQDPSATPAATPAQQPQEQPTEELSVSPAEDIAATKQKLTDKGYTVGDDNIVYNKNDIAIGTIDDAGVFAGPNGEGIDALAEAEKAGIVYHLEQQRQKKAENGAKSPKYNTDIKAWYTDFNFEDPSSWIPRLLAGLLGATLGGALSKNPLGAVLGGVAGWGLGGGAASNWDTLFSTEEQRKAKALAEHDAKEKAAADKQAFDQAVANVVHSGAITDDYNVNLAAFKQLRTQLEEMDNNTIKRLAANADIDTTERAKYEQALKARRDLQQKYLALRSRMQLRYGENF